MASSHLSSAAFAIESRLRLRLEHRCGTVDQTFYDYPDSVAGVAIRGSCQRHNHCSFGSSRASRVGGTPGLLSACPAIFSPVFSRRDSTTCRDTPNLITSPKLRAGLKNLPASIPDRTFSSPMPSRRSNAQLWLPFHAGMSVFPERNSCIRALVKLSGNPTNLESPLGFPEDCRDGFTRRKSRSFRVSPLLRAQTHLVF